MLRGLFAIGLLFVTATSAHAQQRVMNPDAAGVVRAWPISGIWLVTLSRSIDGDLFCAIGTGHQDRTLDDNYVWGLRWRNGVPGLFVSDRREEALKGGSLRIAIDGTKLGEFPIDRRRRVVDMVTINAGLTQTETSRLLNVMRHGASMTFSTATANYVAPLDGVKLALSNIDACNVEARDLNPPPP